MSNRSLFSKKVTHSSLHRLSKLQLNQFYFSPTHLHLFSSSSPDISSHHFPIMQPTFPNTNHSANSTALLCSLPAYLLLLLPSLPLSYLSNSTSFPTFFPSFQAISKLSHVNPPPVLIFLPLFFRLCSLLLFTKLLFSSFVIHLQCFSPTKYLNHNATERCLNPRQ